MAVSIESEIIQRKRELAALRAAKLKSAQVLKTKTATVEAEFELVQSVDGSGVIAKEFLEITLNIQGLATPITQCVLASAYDGRLYPPIRNAANPQAVQFVVRPTVFTEADRAAVLAGETVRLNATFLITATSEFTLSTQMVESPYV